MSPFEFVVAATVGLVGFVCLLALMVITAAELAVRREREKARATRGQLEDLYALPAREPTR